MAFHFAPSRAIPFLFPLPHNKPMQERKLQKNILAKAPTNLKADIIKSGKRALSEEKQKQLNDMLLDAAKAGKTKRAERLLKKGASIEAKDNGGWTALMFAAWNGNTPTCAFLLDKGANINAKDNNGATALMRAAWNGHTQTCALLLEHNASIEAKSNGDGTVLRIAAWRGHTQTCIFLLEKGADLNAEAEKGDWKGMAASSIAEGNGEKETAAFLKSMEWLADATGNIFMKSFSECIGQ
jgi:ankyrin repeat protein